LKNGEAFSSKRISPALGCAQGCARHGEKRAFVNFKSPLVFVVIALGVAACTAHNGFAGLPSAGSVGPLLTNAEPTSIPLTANAGNKSGFHVQLSIAGTPAKSFLFDTGSGGLWVYANTIANPKKPVRDLHIAARNTYGSGLHYDCLLYTSTGQVQGIGFIIQFHEFLDSFYKSWFGRPLIDRNLWE